MIDLEPAARSMATVVRNIADGTLALPTPCPEYRLGALVGHVAGLTVAFSGAASKDLDAGSQRPPATAAGGVDSSGAPGDAGSTAGAAGAADWGLPDDWRERIATDLDTLVAAWRNPAAWTGMTRAGGVDLPGEIAGLVALDELVVHGWDVAAATGQTYDVDRPTLETVRGMLAESAADRPIPGLFGVVVDVPPDAPLLDRVIGLSGRDPRWTSTAL